MPLPTTAFSLSQLIKATADELRVARAQSPKDAVIQLTGCEIELAVTVQAEAGGGIKFWVVDAKAKASGETVSTIKLNFSPAIDYGRVLALTDGSEAAPFKAVPFRLTSKQLTRLKSLKSKQLNPRRR